MWNICQWLEFILLLTLISCVIIVNPTYTTVAAAAAAAITITAIIAANANVPAIPAIAFCVVAGHIHSILTRA